MLDESGPETTDMKPQEARKQSNTYPIQPRTAVYETRFRYAVTQNQSIHGPGKVIMACGVLVWPNFGL